MKMLSFKDFRSMSSFSSFCEYHNLDKRYFKQGWHDIINTLADNRVQYTQYKHWYGTNMTKLAIYLRGNDASFKEDK
jgi:hypothetical protein